MGKRDQSRKPKRRERVERKPNLDDDLIELALALDVRADAGYDAWFSIPWNDGWNAAQLAADSFGLFPCGSIVLSGHLIEAIRDRRVTNNHYVLAEELMLQAAAYMYTWPSFVFLVAGFRCVQLKIANSDGGGHGYNGILLRAFERWGNPTYNSRYDTIDSDMQSAVIANARCRDAIGVDLQLANDQNDKLRRAFRIAWERGLYKAAYALPRAKGV